MTGLSRRAVVAAMLAAMLATSCAAAPVPPRPVESPEVSVALPLDLQVRNSGLPGGYLWLAEAGRPDTGRWHRFGMAEFICVTCPNAFVGSGTGYDIAVLDEQCRVRAADRTVGGQLLVEIDLGPTVKLVEAPPLQDWLPGDSAPADPAEIPCSRP